MQISEPSNSLKAQGGAHDALGRKEEKVKSVWHRVELGLLGTVIVVVWVLLGLPIILYHLPESSNQPELTTAIDTCSREEGSLYTGECRAELATLQSCIPNETATSDVYVGDGLDLSELDSQIRTLKAGLEFIGASPECESAAIPLFCLYLFGLCDAPGTLHQPSYSDCISISTDTCAREWEIVTTEYSSVVTLPQCDSFQMTNSICNNTGNRTSSASGPTLSSPIPSMIVPSSANVSETGNCSNSGSCNAEECSDGFYCSEHGVCLPRCDEWEEFPHNKIVALDVVVLLTATLGGISGTLVLILSCVYRRRMFVFPLVIIVYLTITLECFAILVLISYTDRNKLHCSSCDLVQSVDNPTSFCTFAGAALLYIYFQLTIWWFCHVLLIFWKIRFPFHAKHFEGAGYIKYIHIAVVTLALLIPAVPIIILFGIHGEDAFLPAIFPPILCAAREPDVIFYAVTLPVAVLSQAGVTIMIMLFWVIHKRHGLFRIKQMKTPYTIGTPERKILIIFCYSILLLVFVTISFTLGAKNAYNLAARQTEYFRCEAVRTDFDPPCSRSYLDYLFPEVYAIGIALVGMFPAVNLIFVVSTGDVKKLWKKVRNFIPSAA